MDIPAQEPRAKIFVLGTAHEVQSEKFQMAVDDECYRDIVDYLIRICHVDTIFEEASGHLPSHAQIIADSHSPKLSYVDVDPSRVERERHNLATDTGDSVPIDFWSQPPCVVRFEYVAKHAGRETFWLKKIDDHKFESALFICGVSHALSFSFRLADAGYEVERCSTYLPYEKLCRHVPATS
jgi:hypothetical protein